MTPLADRLLSRVDRPGLVDLGPVRALAARHLRMTRGVPLADLLGRRVTDGGGAAVPLVYAERAAAPAAAELIQVLVVDRPHVTVVDHPHATPVDRWQAGDRRWSAGESRTEAAGPRTTAPVRPADPTAAAVERPMRPDAAGPPPVPGAAGPVWTVEREVGSDRVVERLVGLERLIERATAAQHPTEPAAGPELLTTPAPVTGREPHTPPGPLLAGGPVVAGGSAAVPGPLDLPPVRPERQPALASATSATVSAPARVDAVPGPVVVPEHLLPFGTPAAVRPWPTVSIVERGPTGRAGTDAHGRAGAALPARPLVAPRPASGPPPGGHRAPPLPLAAAAPNAPARPGGPAGYPQEPGTYRPAAARRAGAAPAVPTDLPVTPPPRPDVDLDRLTEQVHRRLARRLVVDRERGGVPR